VECAYVEGVFLVEYPGTLILAEGATGQSLPGRLASRGPRLHGGPVKRLSRLSNGGDVKGRLSGRPFIFQEWVGL